MKGKFMIIAALLGALTFGACVDTEESSSVTAIRNAKAEQLKSIATLNNAKAQAEATIAAAQAQLAAAQAQLLAAEAAAINAETEAQKIANELEAAQAAKKIAKIEAEMALAALQYEQELLEAQLAATAALKDLADEEKEILSTAYTKYFSSLAELKDAQDALVAWNKAIADKNKEIVKKQETLAKTDTLEEAIAAATEDVAKKQEAYDKAVAADAAAAAAVTALREQGAVSYTEALAQQKALAEELVKKNNTLTLAIKTEADAAEAVQDYYTDIAKEKYYTKKAAFIANSTLGFVSADLDEDEDEINEVKVFYPVVMNTDTTKPGYGTYSVQDLNAAELVGEPVALFDTQVWDVVYDDEDNFMYMQRVAFEGIHANAIEAYEDELLKLLSTSPEAKALEVKAAYVEAYEETINAPELLALYEAYQEDVKAVIDEKAEIEAEIASLTYEKAILVEGNRAGYYDEEIKEIEAEITALGKELAALVKEQEDLTAEVTAAAKELGRKSYANFEKTVTDYANHLEELLGLTEAFVDKAAIYAEEVAALEELASLSEAFVATYVTEYNAAEVAYYNAAQALAAAQKAKDEVAAKKNAIDATVVALASSAEDSAEYLLHLALEKAIADHAKTNAAAKAASTALASAKKTLENLQNADAEKAAAALEAYNKTVADAIKTLQEAVAAMEAQIPEYEADIVVAEAYVANCKAALDAALAM